MFGTLYSMMSGGLEELHPRRRRAPSISFDPGTGAFQAEDGPDRERSTWLGRGEEPGAVSPEPAQQEGLTVHEEMQRMARRAATVRE